MYYSPYTPIKINTYYGMTTTVPGKYEPNMSKLNPKGEQIILPFDDYSQIRGAIQYKGKICVRLEDFFWTDIFSSHPDNFNVEPIEIPVHHLARNIPVNKRGTTIKFIELTEEQYAEYVLENIGRTKSELDEAMGEETIFGHRQYGFEKSKNEDEAMPKKEIAKKREPKFVTSLKEYEAPKESDFTEEECKEVALIAHELDISDPHAILNFGADCQLASAETADSLISKFQSGVVTEASETIDKMVKRAQGLNMKPLMKKDNIWSKTFAFVPNREEKLESFKTSFDDISTDFEKMGKSLSKLQQKLIDNIESLGTMYEDNMIQLRELSVYIAAGEHKIAQLNEEIIPDLEKAAKEGNEFKAMELQQAKQAIDGLKRKIENLKILRISGTQFAQQAQVICGTNIALANNIRETETMIVPLWKKQFAIGMQIVEQEMAGGLTQNIDQATNQTLIDTADLTKMSAVEAAKMIANSSSRIDLKTLDTVQNKLLEAVEKTVDIKLEDQDAKISKIEKKVELKSTRSSIDDLLGYPKIK